MSLEDVLVAFAQYLADNPELDNREAALRFISEGVKHGGS